ncbi:MAG: hypothetical protein A3E82_01880 [Gammaproteobacteria bacterium RIFCSPHIGHO2_12_FULL_38_11]|nr:MAG: hypothetical protein A3E82_01880 [Gammaproteobacteria bacterium RIFCSPHIGHO2_12_FULL_38_11]
MHSDFSLDNFTIEDSGEIHLIDFGKSTLLFSSDDANHDSLQFLIFLKRVGLSDDQLSGLTKYVNPSSMAKIYVKLLFLHYDISADITGFTNKQCAEIMRSYIENKNTPKGQEIIVDFSKKQPEKENAKSILELDKFIEYCLSNFDITERKKRWDIVKSNLPELSTDNFFMLLRFGVFDDKNKEDNEIIFNLCKNTLDEINADQLISLISMFSNGDQYAMIWHSIENRLDTLIENVLIENIEQFAALYTCDVFNDAQLEQILKSAENKFYEWCKQDPSLEEKLLGWDQLSETHRNFVSRAIHKNVVEEVSVDPSAAALVANRYSLICKLPPGPHQPAEPSAQDDQENTTPGVEGLKRGL